MKLMTKDVEKLLEKNPLYSHDEEPLSKTKVLVKYFVGPATWYVSEGSKDGDDWIFFGVVHIAGNEPELGEFTLSELEALRVGPLGFRVERDLYLTPGKYTLADALKMDY